MIAALFVEARGVYAGRAGVDPWDVSRDARSYTGTAPAVAHPPCERWGRWWWADGSAAPGNDGGCFASALEAVERCGGVIEHPAYSHAWAAFDLPRPSPGGGWTRNLYRPGWSCHIEQRHYGHKARKATWLLYTGVRPPAELVWGPSTVTPRPWAKARGVLECLSKRQRAATPPAFADVLIALARGALWGGR